jgi:hypothetical protein
MAGLLCLVGLHRPAVVFGETLGQLRCDCGHVEDEWALLRPEYDPRSKAKIVEEAAARAEARAQLHATREQLAQAMSSHEVAAFRRRR